MGRAAFAADEIIAVARTERIASINLCTDSMLLELAPASRITSVSWLSRDPAVSYWVDKARQVAVNRGNAEEVLIQRPDLVLSGTYTAKVSQRLLKQFGVPVLEFDPAQSIDGFKANFRRLAKAIGLAADAEQRLNAMDTRLSKVVILTANRRLPSPSAVVYGANGSSIGKQSLLNDILRLAGIDNVSDRLTTNAFGNVDLEMLLIANPDMLIFSELNPDYPSIAEQFMRHRALRAWHHDRTSEKAGSQKTSINLPARYSNCGGTFIAEAVERLVRHRVALYAE